MTMRSTGWTRTVAVALAAGAAAWTIGPRRAAPPGPAAPVDADAISRLSGDTARANRRYDALMRNQQALRAQLDALSDADGYEGVGEHATDDGAAALDPGPERAAPGRAAPEDVIAGLTERLHRVVDAQPQDPAWSERAADEVAARVGEFVTEGSDLVDVTCRATACRLDVTHAEVGDAAVFADGIVDAIPWNGELFYRIDDEPGEVRTVVFIAREGHALDGDATP